MLEIWVSLAMATTIMSWWSLYKPIRAKLNTEHLIKRNPKISFFVWSVSVLILAPVIVPVIMLDYYKEAFIDGFVEGAEEDIKE